MISKYSFSAIVLCVFFTSCGDDSTSEVTVPETYTFLRDGNSTVSFEGQTTRIMMAEELSIALSNVDSSENELLDMYRNSDENGGDVNPFESSELNVSTKSIKSKIASSFDFFSTKTAESSIIKQQFENWIANQVNEVFPNEEVIATPGVAGQLADGTSVRYVSGKGLEYNQAIGKSIIGALMVDQILNNYLSPSVLDAADNKANNDNGIVENGKTYTTMEHKWDEAYGYLFGNSASSEDPISNIGDDDNFLNKYVGSVDKDSDFTGIAKDIFDAFKKGRAAIVAGNYEVRDEQADIIKEKISEVIAIRAVHYLQQGKNALPTDGNLAAYGPAFHELSEGLGFVYSLRFTRKSGASESYFSRGEVDGFINSIYNDKPYGFWDVDAAVLDEISNEIAKRFEFTITQAAD